MADTKTPPVRAVTAAMYIRGTIAIIGTDQVAAMMQQSHSATITDVSPNVGTRVRCYGITATSTAGTTMALLNWAAAVMRREKSQR